MDFVFSDDQEELQRLVRDVATRECPPSRLRAVLAGDDDGTALWKTYVGLDWPSLTVPEEDGGMGFTAIELVIVLEELGRVADPSPMLTTTSQYTPAVRSAGDAGQRQALLGAVCAGGTGTVAWDADVRAEPGGDGWVLRGGAQVVMDGDRADEVVVPATTPDGPALFVVPGAEVGAERRTTFDETLHVADLVLDGVAVGADRRLAGGATGLEEARAEALVGLAASMVGTSQRLLDMGLEHIKERKQFGVPIGSFQALKHMAVDVHVAIERARALCHFAALTIAEHDDRRRLAASMAKAAAGDAQRIAAQHSTQFFGGLGYTWENDLHLFVRRAKAGELLLGTSAEHKTTVARATIVAVDEEGTR